MRDSYIKLLKKIKKSKFRIMIVLVFFAFPIYNVLLVTFHHYSRISMQKIVEINDKSFFSLNPNSVKNYFRWENKEVIRKFNFNIPDTIKIKKSVEEVICLLNYLGYLNVRKNVVTIPLPESPGETEKYFIQQHYRGTCYNDAILFSTILQKEGYFTRIIGLEGIDGLGGNSHSSLEVWIKSLNKWVFIDPQQTAYFTNREGNYLSALEVRDIILTSKNKSIFDAKIRISQGPGHSIERNSIFEFYTSVFQDINYYSNNDFYTESVSSLSRKISNIIENQFTFAGKYAIWFGRMFRSINGQQFLRFRLIDIFNNESFKPNYWYYFYFIFYYTWILSFTLCVILLTKFILIKFFVVQYKIEKT